MIFRMKIIKGLQNNMRTLYYIPHKILFFTLALTLSACGGGGGSSGTPAQAITGGAIKGPLVNATVTVYALDTAQPGFKGAVIDTGTTDARAAITGLNLPLPLTPPYIMEFTSSAETMDMTTGQYPVVATLSTVLTQSLIDSGNPVYATPLTTMALAIAINNSTSTTSAADFLAKLPAAANQVVATVGFGMSSNIDIFASPPVLDNTVDNPQKQSDVLAYRTAIEALTTVAFEMQQDGSTTATAEAIISELANDLTDGIIDGNVNSTVSTIYNSTTLDVFTQDPVGLMIPNAINGETVAQVNEILVAEAIALGSTASTTGLSDGSITVVVIPASTTSANKAVWNSFNWNDGSVWQ